MNLRLKIAGAVSTIALLATATSAIAQEIRVWTTETQPARLERQQKMAADYEASTGVKVQMIPVEESDYGTRATAAFAAGDLPDVIYHTLQYVLTCICLREQPFLTLLWNPQNCIRSMA